MSKSFTTEAIILKRRNFAEADRLLTVFSRHYGKITCLAKGVRRPTSRKKGSIEPFTHAKLFIVKGKSLDLVTQAEAIQTFSPLAKNLNLNAAASYLCELVDKLTAEQQANPQVFSLLLSHLQATTATSVVNQQQLNTYLDRLKLNFAMRLLQLLGFGMPSKRNLESLGKYIESIMEKRINSNKIIKGLNNSH